MARWRRRRLNICFSRQCGADNNIALITTSWSRDKLSIISYSREETIPEWIYTVKCYNHVDDDGDDDDDDDDDLERGGGEQLRWKGKGEG
ncbi:hypothetical protein PoB_001079200 [Plakobranchus ocellatus]|uniref:Uncharacterized protein n=1 Tax=Plakobranchus ocellatus TaxID=259542 RepID=A0AAV3YMW6_9GAST|nr:hypothetical protein PoB_001079200 [Plakobranchus ocellatus]